MIRRKTRLKINGRTRNIDTGRERERDREDNS